MLQSLTPYTIPPSNQEGAVIGGALEPWVQLKKSKFRRRLHCKSRTDREGGLLGALDHGLEHELPSTMPHLSFQETLAMQTREATGVDRDPTEGATPPPYGPPPTDASVDGGGDDDDTTLLFESRFESGSLRRAVQGCGCVCLGSGKR